MTPTKAAPTDAPTAEQLANALRNVLADAVTDHSYQFPGCPGCNAVIEARRLLAMDIGMPNPSWLADMKKLICRKVKS